MHTRTRIIQPRRHTRLQLIRMDFRLSQTHISNLHRANSLPRQDQLNMLLRLRHPPHRESSHRAKLLIL